MADMTFKAKLLPAVSDSTEYTLGSSTSIWQIAYKNNVATLPSSGNTVHYIPYYSANGSNTTATSASLNGSALFRFGFFSAGYNSLELGQQGTSTGFVALRHKDNATNIYTQLMPSVVSGTRTIYLPDAGGTVALTSDLSNYSTTSHTHSNYVLKAGDTMTGPLTVSKSSASDGNAYIRITANNKTVGLHVGSGGVNRGIYDWTAANWIIYCDGTDARTTMKLYGAVWNDYAEFRETKEKIEPGRCIREVGDDTLVLTSERLQRGCEIVSDTFGFAIGQSEKCKTPTAASGRVLAYLYEDREEAKKKIGWPVCSGPNGTVSIMTEEEEEKYPSRIIGTISAVPDYEIWYAETEDDPIEIKVNGRVWIRIR